MAIFLSDQYWTIEFLPSPVMILKVWDQRLISVFLSNPGSEIAASVIAFSSFGFALTFVSCWLKILKGKMYQILFPLRKIIKVSYGGRGCIKILSSAFQDISKHFFLQSLGLEWRCAISLTGPIENSPDVICNRLCKVSSKFWRIWIPLGHPPGG